MKQESIRFSMHDLVIGGHAPDGSMFVNVPTTLSVTDDDGVSGIAEIENTGRYLWMYSRSGRSMPRSTEVINTRTQQCEDNPRSRDQAELRNQGFCLYDYDTNLLYISSGIDFFQKIIAQINPEIRIRNLYKTRDEFLKSLRKVSKVRFVAKEDLFTWQSDLFAASGNLLGLGNPKQLVAEFKFPYASVTGGFMNFLKGKGVAGCDTNALSSLIVAGLTEEGDRLIESTFNLKNLGSSISIYVSRDDDGMYDEIEVKENLLAHLR